MLHYDACTALCVWRSSSGGRLLSLKSSLQLLLWHSPRAHVFAHQNMHSAVRVTQHCTSRCILPAPQSLRLMQMQVASQIPPEDKERAEKAIDDAISWLDANQLGEVRV